MEGAKCEKKQGKKVDIVDSNDVVVGVAVSGDGADDDVAARDGVEKDDVEKDGADRVSLMVD